MSKINFESTLVKYIDNKKYTWSISLYKNIVQSKIEENGKELYANKEKYCNNKIARYHLLKEILTKRSEGYKLPNSITMKELLKIKPTPIDKLREKLGDDCECYDLEGCDYKNFIFIDGDLCIDNLNLDAFEDGTTGILVRGDLIVDGGIYNIEGDYGSPLVVSGKVVADYIVGGGSEIVLRNKNNFIHSFVYGHYNHGLLEQKGTALVVITNDHNTWVEQAYYKYDVWNEFNYSDNQFPSLKEILSSSFSELINEDGSFNSELFMRLLSIDTKLLELIKLILDANYANNPQMEQVVKNGLAIKRIEKPSKDIQLAAVRQNGLALEFIENPDEEVQIEAVFNNPWALEYIKNPSEAVQLSAVESTTYGSVGLSLLKNPSDKVIHRAIEIDGRAIEYIDNPSEDIKLAAVKSNADAIEYIDNPSEELQIIAIQLSSYALSYIQNPTKRVKKLQKELIYCEELLGNIYYEDNINKKEKLLQEYIQTYPYYAPFLLEYAILLMQEYKNFKKAKKYLQMASNSIHNDPNIYANYAQTLILTGKKQEAKKYIDKALKMIKVGTPVETELWFYRLAHFPQYYKEAQLELDRLLEDGQVSIGWNLNDNIELAKKEGFKDIELLKKYAKKITEI